MPVLAAGLIASVDATADPIRIVCIGDSITQGGRSSREEFTYRLPLYRTLRAAGFDVDFVGTRNTGVDREVSWPADFDPDHEGFYGFKTAAVRDALKTDLPKIAPADIALVHLGTNDRDGDPVKDVAVPLAEIVGMLRTRNPRVKVLIAQIPGMMVSRMHFAVWRVAVSMNTSESAVVTVPFYQKWDSATDTHDGVHPNRIGEAKMARRWLDEIEPLLSNRLDESKRKLLGE